MKMMHILTVLTFLLLSLFFLQKITDILFLTLFIPLAIAMIIVGIVNIKKAM